MTTAALIQRVRDLLAYDLDFFQGDASSVTDAMIATALNEAVATVADELLVYGDSSLTSGIGVKQYDLASSAWSNPIITPDYVIVDGKKLVAERWDRPGLWPWELFDQRYEWRTASNGTPVAATVIGRKLTFNCPFAAAVSVVVVGNILPAKLDAATPNAELECDPRVHPDIATLAAVRSALPTVVEGQQRQRLSDMSGVALDHIKEVGRLAKIDKVEMPFYPYRSLVEI